MNIVVHTVQRSENPAWIGGHGQILREIYCILTAVPPEKNNLFEFKIYSNIDGNTTVLYGLRCSSTVVGW